ncbi:MAG: hypothetical protein M1831_001572 [Alyxoria varia]|nr:MAG: hypothetical protein M1831_001572 [Alyxoria varia]
MAYSSKDEKQAAGVMENAYHPPTNKDKQEHTATLDTSVSTTPTSAQSTLASAGYTPATAAEEAAVIRKLDVRLLPFVFVLYSLSILDRSNISNAKLAGMEEDLRLEGGRYEWLGTGFYLGYILFQWLTAGWKQFPAHIWATFAIFFWGFIATIQATTTNFTGIMACRVILGLAEATFGPGVPLYLSFFYPREKVGFRQGIFISGAAIANAYGGALAYGITQIDGRVAPWRILFVIEGIPTCCVAVFAWFFLPDSIAKARFLTEREKRTATIATAREQVIDEGAKKSGIRWKDLWKGMRDPKSILPAIMYFSVNVSFASLPLFLPTIIEEIGAFSTIQSQGLSAPPYALVFVSIIAVSLLSDRFRLRGPFIAAAALIAAAGFMMLAIATSAAARYTGVFLAVQIFVCVSLLVCWLSNLHASESGRTGGFIVMYTVGQCGPLVGSNIFPDSQAPYFRKGMWISTAFCLLVAVTAATLSAWLIKENKNTQRREEEEGESADEERETMRRNIW